MPNKKPESASSPLEDEETYTNRREAPRRSVWWRAIVHLGKYEFNCKIRNFSLGGLELHFEIPLKEGTIIEIEIPRRDVILRAEVAWQRDETMGIQFLEDPKDIRAIFGKSVSDMGADAPGSGKAFSGALIP